MSSDVVLSSALRSNLLSLQRTQTNVDQVQNALSSGLKVSSALDNPQSYFAARSLNNRASDLSGLLDGIGQSVSAIKQANTSVDKLSKLVEQADSIVSQAATAAADAQIAKVTGNIDLSGVTNITSLAGVTNTDQLVIKVNNPDDATVTYSLTVTLSTNDSIEQVLTKINNAGVPTAGSVNGSYDSAGEAFVEASLSKDGGLQIQAANGGKIQIDFQANEASTTTDDAINLAFAKALGFGGIAQLVAEAGTAGDSAVQVTAVPGTSLQSGIFYKASSGTDFADASALLSSVYDDASSRALRFATTTSGTDNVQITVNNTTVVNVAVDQNSTTIQGFIDSINTNATLKNYVHASYDATTGHLSIDKISNKLNTIEISDSPGTGVANTTVKTDFDFGLTGTFSVGTQTRDVSEVFTFGTSSGQLAQLEKDYNKVRDQIDGLIGDSAYSGTNLLQGEDLTTYFNADRSSSLVTSGSDLSTSGLGLAAADFSSGSTIAEYGSVIKAALDTIRSYSGSLSNDLSIIQARQEFTKETIDNLKEGSDKLTVADQNEEGAKLLALQTRQQLGVTALSLASQAQQSVLRLF